MDILQEIKKEHDEYRDTMEALADDSLQNRLETFQAFQEDVIAHHEAEEYVLYSKMKENEEAKDLALEMIEEHELLHHQFEALTCTSIQDETWDAKFTVLKEVLEHHLQEEETDAFKQAMRIFEEKQLNDMRAAFEKAKEEYRQDVLEEKESQKKRPS